MRNVKEINLETGGIVYSPAAILVHDETGNSAPITANLGNDICLDVQPNPEGFNDNAPIAEKLVIEKMKWAVNYESDFAKSSLPTTKMIADGDCVQAADLPTLVDPTDTATFNGWEYANEPIKSGKLLRAKWTVNTPCITITNAVPCESCPGTVVTVELSYKQSIKANSAYIKIHFPNDSSSYPDRTCDTIDLNGSNTQSIRVCGDVSLLKIECTAYWTFNDTEYHSDTVTCNCGTYCFAAGTRIAMGNGETKKIENIRTFDYVLTRNLNTNTNELQKVNARITPVANHSIKIVFTDNSFIITTWGHPFYAKTSDAANYSWKSYSPHILPDGTSSTALEIGDCIFTGDEHDKVIKSITYRTGKIQMYSFETANGNYYANGMLVADTQITNINYSYPGVKSDVEIETTDNNHAAIGTISENGVVNTINIDTMETKNSNVVSNKNIAVNGYIKITLANNDVLKVMPAQLIYTENGWRTACNEVAADNFIYNGPLTTSDKIACIDGTYVAISAIEYVADASAHANLLDVEDNDTFFIYGISKYIMHNAVIRTDPTKPWSPEYKRDDPELPTPPVPPPYPYTSL